MVQEQTYRIQAEAAQALAEWKAFFAQEVSIQAKELAKTSSPTGLITLDHYRQAAAIAAQTLATVVFDKSLKDGSQKAA